MILVLIVLVSGHCILSTFILKMTETIGTIFAEAIYIHVNRKNSFEPRHEKTNVLVSDLVQHKPDCTVTAKLTCVFVFAYAKCWFSHDEAQFRFAT